ncbi:MAG: hypothetical protein HOI53_05350 [Francisellaceae bacterium]|jgi:methylglutaconyl-CoA hydratase|nr:hypothetical protein [Francisellaceae bacterium]MBT6207432.1 hypothetical protein [Francisellaceae bacterium]MBT6538780.1 hypothetical protein [Francisellaceae bacterium]
MSAPILSKIESNIGYIGLNRPDVHHAFNAEMITSLQNSFQTMSDNPKVKVIILHSNGENFCAGADLNHMQNMINYSEQDNFNDAKTLSDMLFTIYSCPKPTIAKVQGSAFGGGVGLISACDIAICAEKSSFCLSEVKLGLVPAIISPYITQALGNRVAKYWMLTAKRFTAKEAKDANLVHEICSNEDLDSDTFELANKICHLGKNALANVKTMLDKDNIKDIKHSQEYYCNLIAKLRVSEEGQAGIQAFLNKNMP